MIGWQKTQVGVRIVPDPTPIGRAPITQDELEIAIARRNDLMDAKKQYSRLALDLLCRRRCGCPVEPGPHRAEIEEIMMDDEIVFKLDLR